MLTLHHRAGHCHNCQCRRYRPFSILPWAQFHQSFNLHKLNINSNNFPNAHVKYFLSFGTSDFFFFKFFFLLRQMLLDLRLKLISCLGSYGMHSLDSIPVKLLVVFLFVGKKLFRLLDIYTTHIIFIFLDEHFIGQLLCYIHRSRHIDAHSYSLN